MTDDAIQALIDRLTHNIETQRVLIEQTAIGSLEREAARLAYAAMKDARSALLTPSSPEPPSIVTGSDERAREVLNDIVPLSISSTWDEATTRNIVRAMEAYAASRPTDAGATVPLYTFDEAWDELVNKDDRTSPEEYPEMCLIARDELRCYMEAVQYAPAALATQKPPVDEDRIANVVRNVLYRSKMNGCSADVYDTADEITAAIRNLTGEGAGA